MTIPDEQPAPSAPPRWPCVVNLRDAGDRRTLSQRLRDSFRSSRDTWRENPRLAGSWVRWCVIGLLGLTLAAMYLGAGVPLSRAVGYGSVLLVWALAWAFILGLHIGLVRQPGEPLRKKVGLPNALTLMRIMFIPAVCWTILAHERLIPHGLPVAVAVFLVGFSDVLDGLLARWLRWQTELGRYTDHLSDTMICAAVALAEHLAGLMPGWLVGIYLVRYGGMFAGGIASVMINPAIRIAPTWIGRLGTAVAGMVLFLIIAQPLTAPGLKWAMPYLFALAGLLIVVNIVAVLVMLARGHLSRNNPEPRGSSIPAGPSSVPPSGEPDQGNSQPMAARSGTRSEPAADGPDRRNPPENHAKMQIRLDIGQEKG